MQSLNYNSIIDLEQFESVATTTDVFFSPFGVLLPLIASLAISLVVIPVMVRLAPIIGMIDKPDPRKVHKEEIPRVGGVGLFLGAILPIVFLLPMSAAHLAFVAGSLVLFLFGVLDDSKELGHYVKFIGQFIAAILVVYAGGIYVTLMPFMGGEAISPAVGKPFTVLAIVGMINAINHSDGLDGLAGGEVLLSLAGILYLGYHAGSEYILLVALATAGGLLGFMRYNTHPARIFMGDSGSQFLGFVLAVLVIQLTQEANPLLSPAIPLLLLGLPIADILGVFAQRIYRGMNWFRASRNHIHHRLLDLGFHHYESVSLIYSVQAILVLCGVLLPYATDLLIVVVYLSVVAIVFASLNFAESSGWYMRRGDGTVMVGEVIESTVNGRKLLHIAEFVLIACISGFLLSGALFSTEVPGDFAAISGVLAAALMAGLFVGGIQAVVLLRVLAYSGILFVVYLFNTFQPEVLSGTDFITYLFFIAVIACITLIVRLDSKGTFRVTTMDFLILLAILSVLLLSGRQVIAESSLSVVLKSIILFYAAEIILLRMTAKINTFTISLLIALGVIALRGIVP